MRYTDVRKCAGTGAKIVEVIKSKQCIWLSGFFRKTARMQEYQAVRRDYNNEN